MQKQTVRYQDSLMNHLIREDFYQNCEENLEKCHLFDGLCINFDIQMCIHVAVKKRNFKLLERCFWLLRPELLRPQDVALIYGFLSLIEAERQDQKTLVTISEDYKFTPGFEMWIRKLLNEYRKMHAQDV